MGQQSIVMNIMSLCVCQSAITSSNYTSDLHLFFVHVSYVHGSVLLWWRSDTLRISGFLDDVIFAHTHKLRLLDVAARLRLTLSLERGA